MTEQLQHLMQSMPAWGLIAVIVLAIYGLSKGADWLVEESVSLSQKWNVSKALIGATIVSLGTTLPEAAVSVAAAIQGQPELAMGNAVGSIICDTGLILGLAAIIQPLPLIRSVVNRQGWIQLAVAVLLVICAASFPIGDSLFQHGGRLPQAAGFVFLALLAAYLWLSICWAGKDTADDTVEAPSHPQPVALTFLKLTGGIALVILASKFLIPAAEETALRLHVPQGVVAATLVAFGTSLPELVTAMTAVRRGHGEIAVGNIIGADILNVLFVTGAASAVTAGGLMVPALFFRLLFPGMLLVLLIFRIGAAIGKQTLSRLCGIILLSTYILITVISYGK